VNDSNMRLYAATLSLCILAACASQPLVMSENAPQPLRDASAALEAHMAGLDAGLAEATVVVAAYGLDDPSTDNRLTKLVEGFPAVHQAFTIGSKGRVSAVEPGPGHYTEGLDVSGKTHIHRALNNTTPAVSAPYQTEEGDVLVDVLRPVYDDDEFAGLAGVTVDTRAFVAAAVDRALGSDWDGWVTDQASTIVFDADPEEVGRNLLDDPLYAPQPGLRELTKATLRAPWGNGAYHLYHGGAEKLVLNQAHWNTLPFHDTAWTVVLSKVKHGDPALARRDYADLEAIKPGSGLAALAADDYMVRTIIDGDQQYAQEQFNDFLTLNPAAGAIAWVDALGVIRYGTSANATPQGYDLRQARNPDDLHLLTCVRAGNEAWLLGRGFDGGQALFHIAPVYTGPTLIGALLTVRRIPGVETGD